MPSPEIAASTGFAGDTPCPAGAWDSAVRASGAVETWHSFLRPHLAVHRTLSPGLLALVAIYYNHHVAPARLPRRSESLAAQWSARRAGRLARRAALSARVASDCRPDAAGGPGRVAAAGCLISQLSTTFEPCLTNRDSIARPRTRVRRHRVRVVSSSTGGLVDGGMLLPPTFHRLAPEYSVVPIGMGAARVDVTASGPVDRVGRITCQRRRGGLAHGMRQRYAGARGGTE
jgi:hypothetical protein